ncbi:hypothetical protein [Streptococcus ruminantium]|uniref:hypothetical protein n=1 Tax=Streptococcus ruminantium TaxID=1917441 RepID=UPI0012DF6431|nr:hypothetical protein [Streptococcus ruminantium]
MNDLSLSSHNQIEVIQTSMFFYNLHEEQRINYSKFEVAEPINVIQRIYDDISFVHQIADQASLLRLEGQSIATELFERFAASK